MISMLNKLNSSRKRSTVLNSLPITLASPFRYGRGTRSKDHEESTVPPILLRTADAADGRSAVPYLYIGYPLHLSPTEARILDCVVIAARPAKTDVRAVHAKVFDFGDGDSDAADDKRYVPTETLRRAAAPSPNTPITSAQLSVHIARINRKSRHIGGRKLILGKSHHGYCLNPFP